MAYPSVEKIVLGIIISLGLYLFGKKDVENLEKLLEDKTLSDQQKERIETVTILRAKTIRNMGAGGILVSTLLILWRLFHFFGLL